MHRIVLHLANRATMCMLGFQLRLFMLQLGGLNIPQPQPDLAALTIASRLQQAAKAEHEHDPGDHDATSFHVPVVNIKLKV